MLNLKDIAVDGKEKDVKIKPFAMESLKHIQLDDLIRIAKDPDTCVAELAKMVHGPKENKTIRTSPWEEGVYYVTDEEGEFTIGMTEERMRETVYNLNKMRMLKLIDIMWDCKRKKLEIGLRRAERREDQRRSVDSDRKSLHMFKELYKAGMLEGEESNIQLLEGYIREYDEKRGKKSRNFDNTGGQVGDNGCSASECVREGESGSHQDGGRSEAGRGTEDLCDGVCENGILRP